MNFFEKWGDEPIFSCCNDIFPAKTKKHTVYKRPTFMYNKENAVLCPKLGFSDEDTIPSPGEKVAEQSEVGCGMRAVDYRLA